MLNNSNCLKSKSKTQKISPLVQISELYYIFILPRQCYHWNLYVTSCVLSLEWRYFLLKKVFIFLVLLILSIPDINFNTALLNCFPCFSFRFTFSKKQKNLPSGLDFIHVNYFPCIQPNVFQNVRLNARKVHNFSLQLQCKSHTCSMLIFIALYNYSHTKYIF